MDGSKLEDVELEPDAGDLCEGGPGHDGCLS